jgi:hypothetical protein
VRLAGGQDVLGREGEGSTRVTWQQILDARPEVIVLMSCGYDVRRNLAAWSDTTLPDGWSQLPAVAAGRVHAVDANAYFSRPGPRLAQGVALLASLFHPECAVPEWAREAARSAQQAGLTLPRHEHSIPAAGEEQSPMGTPETTEQLRRG